MDDVIYEEFKGTGNMELVLDRKLAGSGFREKWAQRAEFGCMQPAGISQPDRNITTERKEAR